MRIVKTLLLVIVVSTIVLLCAAFIARNSTVIEIDLLFKQLPAMAVSHSLIGFFISGGAANNERFISSNNFNVKASGDITGSNVLFTGGKISGSALDVIVPRFFLGSETQFVSGSNGNIEISSSNFHLDNTGNVTMAGTVTATAGQIAGFTISGNSLTATNFEIDASGKRITLGDPSSTDLFVADADEGIQLGNNTFGLAPFSVTKAGVLKAVAGTVGGYGISATAISSSNNNLILKNSGEITGSTVLFTGGKVGGFKITSTQITSSNLLFDSGNSKIVVGSANKITIQGGGTDNFITMGSKTAFAQTSTAGVILGMDNNVPSFDLTRNATNYMRFDTSTGVDIKTDTFKLDTATLDIDSSTSRIQVVNGSSNEVVRLGEISDSASDLYGLKVYDGSGTADSNILVKLGGEGNTIGGWTITNDQIQSQNLVIHSSGRLETADFASGVKGWRIDSEGNGTAEFENATIRGTLSTAVFEKETVNAVGGQLYVANSTVISGSGITSASFTTMSVENVSGFVQGEIASLKKVSETGFTTEYILINSASRNDRTSDTNFSGDLFVVRGYSGSLGGVTGSLGGAANSAQDYNPGQVLVSTGRVGTGYIRLNANPNDSATPYIDIVERTGSAIYDIELKTRVGDLSGLSSATLFGNSDPGFGIFTENGFFKGGINATTGSFTGVVHINTSANEIMKLGTNVDSTNDGLHINNNNFWYTTGQFKTGNANNFISHDGDGNVKIISENFTLKGGTKLLMTSESLAFDTSNATTATRTAGTGVFMDNDGNFRVGNASGNRLTFTGTSLELVTDDLNIDTSTFDLSTDGTGKIALGATPPTDISSGTGFFVDGAGNFLAGNASGNFIRFNQSSGAVQVAGEITIAAGSTSEVDFGAGAAASASAASASAALAETTALEASSSAGEAISTATNASASAAEASSSAVTATAAASTAQAAIDDMETQVVLNNDGMDLRNESNLNLVSYGTTTKFFDGVGDAEGNMKLRLNTDGVYAFANTTESFARFYSEGVQIVSGSVERAKFAETTTIGNPSFEHVEVTSASLKLKGGASGNTVRLSMDADGMQIGSVSSGITLNASGDATFNGAITISPSDLPSGTVSGSAQLADAISGSFADASASLATDVNAASASAAEASSSAVTATAAASTAQAAIDTMETQVVLTNEGMSLRAVNDAGNANLNGQDVVQVGTTTKFFDGVDDTDANQKLRLNTDGVFAFANTTQSFARFFNEGVQIVSGGVERAKFAATTTIGNTSFEHVEITETSLKLKDGGTTRLEMNSGGMQIGTVSDGITLNSDGEATFNGTITLPSGTVSASAQLADAISGSSGADSASLADRQSAYETQVQLSSDGMALKDGSGNTLANYGTDVTIGRSDALNQNVFIDSDSVDIRRGTQVTASFGTITTIGPVSSAHTFIDSGSLKLKDGSNERLVMDANGIRMGDQFSVDSSGNASFSGTLTVSAPGTISSSAQLADAISGSSAEVSASLAAQTAQQLVDSASMASSVQLTNEGLNILNSSNNVISEFGADVFVGLQNEEHVKISEIGLELKDNTDVVGKFVAGGATLGKTDGAHISASTLDVHIIKDSDNKAVLDSDSFDIILNGATSASFGATTTIGSAIGQHVKITNDAFEIKTDANTTVLSASSAGLDMAGTIKASGGTIGGFNIGTDLDSSAGTLKLKGATGQITASDAQITGKITGTSGEIGGFTIQNGQLTGSDGVNEMIVSGSGLISAGDFTSALKQAHFGVLVSEGQKFVSESLAPVNPNPLIESNFSGLNLNAAEQQTGLQLNYGNYFKIAGEDGGSAVFRVGELNQQTSGDSAPPPFMMYSEESGLRISSSKFELKDGGDGSLLRVDRITATEGTIGGFTINGNQITGSSGASIATAASGDRAVLDGTNNDLRFYESGKGGIATAVILGKFGSVGFASDTVNQYGLTLSGSGFNISQFKMRNPDILENVSSGVTNVFHTNFGNIDAVLDVGATTDIYRGRASIFGSFKSGLGSDVSTTGLGVGVMGQVEEATAGRWDSSTGIFGVSSTYASNLDNIEGGGIPDGQWAGAFLGPVYISGSAGNALYVDKIIGLPPGGFGPTILNVEGTLQVTSDIRGEADVIAFYSSDERLKQNIKIIENPIDKVKKLRGVEYEWNDKQNTYESGSLDSGIIAQDVEKVLPQLVKERDDGHLGVRHDRLVGLLVEAIKDQQDQIDEMKEQIKELKNGSS